MSRVPFFLSKPLSNFDFSLPRLTFPDVTPNKLTTDQFSRLIYDIRGQRVMLGSDLASIYDVETKALNRAVKRNADRFPKDFIFQISSREWQNLKYQTGTSSSDRELQALRYQSGTLKTGR